MILENDLNYFFLQNDHDIRNDNTENENEKIENIEEKHDTTKLI